MNEISLRILAVAATFLPITSHAADWTKSVIYNFGSRETPRGNLISDKAGNLYGTTDSSIFKLTPPAAGQKTWQKSLLYNFDAGIPFSLVMDAVGNLYGVTGATGTYAGTVFKLTPPTAGQAAWTKTVLHQFDSLHYGPSSGVTIDAAGNLYGAVVTAFEGYGNVYRLAPPNAGKTAWTFTTLASVVDGGGVAFDKVGSLYGTDADTALDQKPTCPGSDCGSVYKLTPPAGGKGPWKKTVIHRFSGSADGALPVGSLSVGAAGVIYGTTEAGGKGSCGGNVKGCGTVFALSPPAEGKSIWNKTTLYQFDPIGRQGPTPASGLSFDSAGNLYGITASNDTTVGRGTAYRLTRPSSGKSAWGFSLLSQFYGNVPQNGLLIDAHGAAFGTASQSKGQGGFVYRLTP
jgi:hypothetical protein